MVISKSSDCPRCGRQMKLKDSQKHGRYQDALYSCRCGATHLKIFPCAHKRRQKNLRVI